MTTPTLTMVTRRTKRRRVNKGELASSSSSSSFLLSMVSSLPSSLSVCSAVNIKVVVVSALSRNHRRRVSVKAGEKEGGERGRG